MFSTLNTRNQLKFTFQIFITCCMIITWALLILFHVYPTQVYQGHCYFYNVHGIFCPGCGGTRAFENMLYGHFLRSFIYHPSVVVTVFFLLFSDISYLLYFITRGKVLYCELKIQHFIALDFVFLINFFIKNLLVLYFGYYAF